MKLTNHENLPIAIVRAIENDGYSRGVSDYSTTMLSKPSRIVALEKQFGDELEEDAADRIFSLVGQLGHSILERSGIADIIEKRLFAPINGKILSGQVDVVDGSVLEDYKFTSIWVAKGGVKDEWQEQASVNSWLCHKNGIKITKARYICIFRDWSKMRVGREQGCPRSQAQVFHIDPWPLDQTEKWIIERINSHEAAMKSLPLCSDSERWARMPKVAVMKTGRKSAVKLFDSEGAALDFINEQPKSADFYTETRPSDSIRCRHYCSCLSKCSQAKELGIFPEPPPPPESTELF